MKYTQLKEKHSKQLDNFEGIFYAFSNEQFAEGMKKIGLAENETSKIYSLNHGGYILKERAEAWADMLINQTRELEEFLSDDNNLFDALVYEYNNHEYCITWDNTDALESLGLKESDVSPEMLRKVHNRTKTEK